MLWGTLPPYQALNLARRKMAGGLGRGCTAQASAYKPLSSNWSEFCGTAKPRPRRVPRPQRAALQARCAFLCSDAFDRSQHVGLILDGRVVARYHLSPHEADSLVVVTRCAYVSHGLGWPGHIRVLRFTPQPCRWTFCPQRPQMVEHKRCWGGGTPRCPKVMSFTSRRGIRGENALQPSMLANGTKALAVMQTSV